MIKASVASAASDVRITDLTRQKKISLVISRLMIALFHPDPATNRNSAILVVQFSDGTATQEFTGGLAVLAFFPDRIAFSATTWEVPWPVHVHNRPPRYPGVSPNSSTSVPKLGFAGATYVSRHFGLALPKLLNPRIYRVQDATGRSAVLDV